MTSSGPSHTFTKVSVLLLIMALGCTAARTMRRSLITDEERREEFVYSGDGEGGDDEDDDVGGAVVDDVGGNGQVGGEEEVFNNTPQAHPQCSIAKNTSMDLLDCDFSSSKSLVDVSESLLQPGIKHLKIRGAASVDFHPMCLSTISFQDCGRINQIDYASRNYCPPLRLIKVDNSTVVKMTGTFHHVKVSHSNITYLAITLYSRPKTIRQITLHHVVIYELEQIINQQICSLKVDNSAISTIRPGALVVKSDAENPNSIRFSNISMVETGGILVEEGELYMEGVVIEKLAVDGITINGSAVVILRNVVLREAHPRGLVLTEGLVKLFSVTYDGTPLRDGAYTSDTLLTHLNGDQVPPSFAQTTLGMVVIVTVVFAVLLAVFFVVYSLPITVVPRGCFHG